jgi:hypothetical protein
MRTSEEIERVVDWAAAAADMNGDDYAEGALDMWLWLIGEVDEGPGEYTRFRNLRG